MTQKALNTLLKTLCIDEVKPVSINNNTLDIEKSPLYLIEKGMEELVKNGTVSIMTEINQPFSYITDNLELKRKFRSNSAFFENNINIIDRYQYEYNDDTYDVEDYITPIKCEQLDSTDYLSNDKLEEIISYCIEENINRIYKIIQVREAIIFDYKNQKSFIKKENIRLSDYNSFMFDKSLYNTKKDDDVEKDEDSYYKNRRSSGSNYHNIKKGYVFNHSYYVVCGIKIFDENIVKEWNNCNDIGYFYKTYYNK